tara:strand:+ start:1697 stop:2287 length:591 start_codon:yes stop_codon:yes gene_type:complete
MMKTLFLTAALALFSIQQHCAQDGTNSASFGNGQLQFGVKAGLNISTFLGRDYLDVTPRVGAYMGGLAEMGITENIFFQPEVLLSFQGADLGVGNLNLTYLHFPLMGKYLITDEIAVELGPQIGFLFGDNGSDYNIVNGNPELNTRSVQLAVNLGGGYRLDEHLYFQVRFSAGLSKVIEDTKTRNGVLQLGACYFF